MIRVEHPEWPHDLTSIIEGTSWCEVQLLNVMNGDSENSEWLLNSAREGTSFWAILI